MEVPDEALSRQGGKAKAWCGKDLAFLKDSTGASMIGASSAGREVITSVRNGAKGETGRTLKAT